MLGLFCHCRVKAVYAAHVLAVELLLSDLRPSRDWLVVRLPVIPPLALRRIAVDDVPPFLPKQMIDPGWSTDSEIEQLGPCPIARKAVVSILRSAGSVAVHIPPTEYWLHTLKPGATVDGDLIVDRARLSQRIIKAQIAKPAN